jgi:site-specific DNA-methyltransferase (cytosine-N4-specific)
VTPFVADGDFTLHVGDALDVLRDMPAESVHCVVTSPPYWGLRDYGTGSWAGGDPDCDHTAPPRGGAQGGSAKSGLNAKKNKDGTLALDAQAHGHAGGGQYERECGKCGATRTDQQLGLEPTPDAYILRMVEVFREVRRVLRRDGTCWLNIGDSYAGGGQAQPQTKDELPPSLADGPKDGMHGDLYTKPRAGNMRVDGLKQKDLVGIPWKLAFALQADGWYLRSDIIWAKPNPMPESVTDRPTKSHEYVFLLTREARYFYDADAIREAAEWARWGDQTNGKYEGSESAAGWIGANKKVDLSGSPAPQTETLDGSEAMPSKGRSGVSLPGYRGREKDGIARTSFAMTERAFDPRGRNARSVWTIATQPYAEAHFATFPEELPRRCIAAGCPEDGVVLDPFMGSGTVALVARRLGRRSIGIELNPEYAELCARRLQQQSLFACVVDESAGMKDGAE